MANKQKNAKQGRQKKSAQNLRYINEHRREKNKVIRLRKHLKKHPGDDCAMTAARLASVALGKTFVLGDQ